jgi:hypothetical protein
MHEDRTSELLQRLDQARHALTEAEQRNAAATLARRPPPYSVDDIRQLEYAVADTTEEIYGGDLLAVGPHAQRMTFPAAG